MQITHQEARRLIHFDTDNALKESEKNVLEAHLESCAECRQYAGSILEMESILQPMLQRRWKNQSLPLPGNIRPLISSSRLSHNILLVTRMTAMGIICIAFLFNIWQFSRSSNQASGLPSVIVPPVPTPSLQSTSTEVKSQECENLQYTVKENDTLASIAHQFSVSQDEITTTSDLSVETVYPSMKLLISVCSSTPLNTVTKTITPLTSPTITTPVGIHTQ